MSDNRYIKATAAASAAPVGAKLMKTGQTTSYTTGDDGNIQAGRATSFLVLPSNNPFGNTNRFTSELGTQTYTNNIVIDWSTYDGSTVLGYRRTTLATAVWATQIANALAVSVGTFTTGWRLTNFNEIANILNWGSTVPLNYAPFNISSVVYFHTSTTYPSGTSAAVKYYGSGQFFQDAKLNTAIGLACRTFTVTGTTLS
jgi:hypothetical protein